jgi:PAS domain-containing protein
MGRAAGKTPLASLPPILPAPDSAGSDSLLVDGRSWGGAADPLEAAVDAEDQHLAEVEALYRAADAGLALLDRDLRYVRLNQRLAAMNGAPLEAHLGRTVREMVPALADEIERVLGCVFATGEPVVGGLVDGQTATRPGVARSWSYDVVPIKRHDGTVRSALVIVREIGLPRPAETLANARLAAIVESADEAIASKTLDGIVTSWNPAAETLFGYTAAEIIGRHISVLAAPGREDEMPAILERIRRGEKVERYETMRRRKDGWSKSP